ncbi:MAG: cobalamin-dependent protein [Rhodospirillales bacterium]|nr:cobalamin-dependent protein [Rhodospirillales bacterium]
MNTTEAHPSSAIHPAVAGLSRPPKVMVTKIGLDGHDRGSRLVASFLRDAGMEVIYTGPWQQVETVVNQAAQEDVDCIGVSSLATDHLLVPKLMKALKAAGLEDVIVIVGGIVPDADEKMLMAEGVARVFHPGCSQADIVGGIADLIVERRKTLGE